MQWKAQAKVDDADHDCSDKLSDQKGHQTRPEHIRVEEHQEENDHS